MKFGASVMNKKSVIYIFEEYGLIPDEDIISKNLDMSKISFDYDGTLSTSKGRALARELIKNNELYIITARHKRDGTAVYSAAKELGIPFNRVYFTEGKDKYPLVKRLGIAQHYDNNEEQVNKINEYTTATGILF